MCDTWPAFTVTCIKKEWFKNHLKWHPKSEEKSDIEIMKSDTWNYKKILDTWNYCKWHLKSWEVMLEIIRKHLTLKIMRQCDKWGHEKNWNHDKSGVWNHNN